jgi:hypothetical protein
MTSSRRIGLLRIAAALALVVVIGLGADVKGHRS